MNAITHSLIENHWIISFIFKRNKVDGKKHKRCRSFEMRYPLLIVLFSCRNIQGNAIETMMIHETGVKN